MSNLEFIKKNIFSDFGFEMNRFYFFYRNMDEKSLHYAESTVDGNVTTMKYTGKGMGEIKLIAEEIGNTVIFSIDASTDIELGGFAPFEPRAGLKMKLGPTKPDAITANKHNGPWWMYPVFVDDYSALPQSTQSMFVKIGDKHIHILPLCADNFRCEFEKGEVYLSPDTMSVCRLSGKFLAVTIEDDPFKAVEENFKVARENGAIRVPLLEEKKLPEFCKGFGWCTWNAFEKEVSAELIYEKLREFKEKKIPLKWLIIDDGWMKDTYGIKIKSIEPDGNRFPGGFAPCIKKIKEEFGVEKVGLWHTLTGGYWFGVEEGSELFEQQKENLYRTEAGIWIPSLDEEKAFKFWDNWHTKLAEAGFDFIKVDNQSSLPRFVAGSKPSVQAVRSYHNAFEKSVEKNFKGELLNCMGMDMESVFSRPFSAVSRNSDDFYPFVERGIVDHLIQNIYNATWHSFMYKCDFDMWWSQHESAYQSGVLRAISGSPIYVSDKIGESVYENIMPTIGDDGYVMMCDGSAKPTTDRMYKNCSDGIQTMWNYSGENFALAAFNLSVENRTDVIDFGSIPGIGDGDYIAYEYFSKTYMTVNKNTKISVEMGLNQVLCYSIYPVKDDEYIMMGSTDKYVPIARADKKVLLSDIISK